MAGVESCRCEIEKFLKRYCFQAGIVKRLNKCISDIAFGRYDFESRNFDTYFHCQYVIDKIYERDKIFYLNDFIKNSLAMMKDKRISKTIYFRFIKGYSLAKCEEIFGIPHTTLSRLIERGINYLAIRLNEVRNFSGI